VYARAALGFIVFLTVVRTQVFEKYQQWARTADVRDVSKKLAQRLGRVCPSCRERSKQQQLRFCARCTWLKPAQVRSLRTAAQKRMHRAQAARIAARGLVE
jgi:hypothetical protein